MEYAVKLYCNVLEKSLSLEKQPMALSMYVYEIPGQLQQLITQQEAILEALKEIETPQDEEGILLHKQRIALLEKLKERVDETSKKIASMTPHEESPKKKRKIEQVLPEDLINQLGVQGLM